VRQGTQPDIVLADIQMPGTSGKELARELRTACGPEAMLFAMSATRPSPETSSAYDGFLMKPFNVADVMAAVSTHAKAKSGARSNVVPITQAQPRPLDTSVDRRLRDIPILNEKIYSQLSVSLPGAQLLEMYTLCISDTRERISRMRTHAENRDSAQFVREAHAIKGSCGMLGASQLHGMAAELENTGLQSTESSSQQNVNSLDELSAACDRLEVMLGSRV
jgi:HPt (histidine-containing phosphotransfer) domain-containing protein